MSSSKSAGARILRGEAGRRAAVASLALEVPLAGARGGIPLAEQLALARAEGFEAGRQEALREAAASTAAERAAQLRQLTDALTAAARAVATQRVDAVRVAEHDAVLLALELTEVVLGRELEVSRSVTVDALQRALALVPSGEDIVVRLHPDDLSVLDTGEGEWRALLPPGAVAVVADSAVEPGGCVLEAGACRVDAQIGPAMARARALLSAAGPAAPAPPAAAPPGPEDTSGGVPGRAPGDEGG